MRWSDLPMSGTFVEMLQADRRYLRLHLQSGRGRRRRSATAETVAPLRTLDGFGAFGPPPSTAKPLPADFRDRATLDHPPGFYGPADGPLAVNTLAAADRIAPLDTSALRARRASYTNAEPRDLRGILLSSSLALFLIDAIIVALLGGGIAALLRRRAVPAAAGVRARSIAAISAVPSPCRAESSDDFAIKAVSQTRLAYVVTGNADVDSIVKAGMAGLTLFLAQRTALEAGDPVGIDPARDELAFFPLIYWPVVPGAAKPPQDAINRIDAYMKQGGTVLFDTRDAIEAPPGDGGASQTPGMLTLRNILSSLDVPELEPVPREHVLTKTFYLLRDFPGRFNSGQTWVEALPRGEDDEDASRPARGGDGVSPIIITSNDLAGAWAIRAGRPTDAAVGAGRTATARIRFPFRGQHRDVHADRKLQGRPGACARADRAAGTIGPQRAVRHRIYTARSLARAVVRARRDRRDRRLAAARAHARRGDTCNGAGADPAGAGQSIVHPRGSRAAVVGGGRRGRQKSQPEFRRAQPRNRSCQARRWSIA